jgi:hypothetical protein
MHMAWSRIDLDAMRAIDPGLYKNKLKEISRELEKELGLTRIGSERDPEQKTLSPARNEFEQSRRLGTDLKAIREDIRACWERSDNGHSFEAALAERGYVLARGDKRDFVIIDSAGGDHALGKRITGATAAETRARLSDIDKNHLPSVDQAKTLQAERAARTVPEQQRGPEYPAAGNTPSPAAATREVADAVRETAAPAQLAQVAAEQAKETNRESRDAAKEVGRDAREVFDAAEQTVQKGSRFARGILGGIAKMVEKLSFLGDMIAPAPPPTRDQAERMERVAEEQRIEEAAVREAAEREARLQVLLDQIRRNDDTDRERKAREREDYDRGRERER